MPVHSFGGFFFNVEIYCGYWLPFFLNGDLLYNRSYFKLFFYDDFRLFLNVEIYCVITTALWSRDRRWSAYIHPRLASMESSVRFL